MKADIKLVLFDLDGTLLDTASDLLAAMNKMRAARQLSLIPLDEVFMKAVNGGKKAMLFHGFAVNPEDPQFAELESEFEKNYSVNPGEHSAAFPGILEVLAELDAHALKWGIVTNKIERFTHMILKTHQLYDRAAVIVCGDTVTHSKPHPMPLLHACHQLNISPIHCIYVGDAETDMIAAERAAMRGAVALFGYGTRHQDTSLWPAHIFLKTPQDLLHWLHSENTE